MREVPAVGTDTLHVDGLQCLVKLWIVYVMRRSWVVLLHVASTASVDVGARERLSPRLGAPPSTVPAASGAGLCKVALWT